MVWHKILRIQYFDDRKLPIIQHAIILGTLFLTKKDDNVTHNWIKYFINFQISINKSLVDIYKLKVCKWWQFHNELQERKAVKIQTKLKICGQTDEITWKSKDKCNWISVYHHLPIYSGIWRKQLIHIHRSGKLWIVKIMNTKEKVINKEPC